MTELIPDNSNRIAALMGKIFHPAVVAVPTLFAVLSELGVAEALRWSLLVLPVVLLPGMMMVFYFERRGKFVYQRQTRGPLYITAWASVMICLLLLFTLNAPRVLIACITTLAVWLPLQLLINTYVTKISTHVAVITGCITALLMLGRLDTVFLQLLAVVAILTVIWARVTTKNHTATQVIMGLLLGMLPVLIIFPALLP